MNDPWSLYKSLSPGQINRMNKVLKKAEQLRLYMDEALEDKQPEKRLALERLTECLMWADSCIVKEKYYK